MAAFSTLYGEVCEQLHDSSAAMVTRAKEWINFAQQEVATAAFWPWLLEIDAIATDADVTTGTAAVANGDATVTITATPTTMPNGQWFFQVAGDTYWYPVASRTDATDFELVVAYQGDTDPVAEYTLRHLTYSLPSDVWAIADIRDQNQPNMLRYASHKTVDLLDIAKIQDGAVNLNRALFHLKDAVPPLIEAFRPRCDQKPPACRSRWEGGRRRPASGATPSWPTWTSCRSTRQTTQL